MHKDWALPLAPAAPAGTAPHGARSSAIVEAPPNHNLRRFMANPL